MIRTAHDIWVSVLSAGIAVCVAAALYEWLVRPHLVEHRAWAAQLKARWDVLAAAVIAAFAAAWDSILDIIIVVINAFPDALQALAGLDLTSLELPGWARILIQLGAALVPVLRAVKLKAA